MEPKATQERSSAFSDGSGLSRQRSELYQSDGGMPAGHPHLGNLQIADDIQWELLKQSQVTSLLLGLSYLDPASDPCGFLGRLQSVAARNSARRFRRQSEAAARNAHLDMSEPMVIPTPAAGFYAWFGERFG